MAYDEHWGGGEPGPAAGAGLVRDHARQAAWRSSTRPRPSWPWAPTATTGRCPAPKTKAAADTDASSTRRPRTPTTPRPRSRWTTNALNPTFGYQDDDGPQAHGLVPRRRHPVQPDQGRRRLPAAAATRCGGWAARTSGVWRCCATHYGQAKPDGPGDARSPAPTSTSTARARCCTSTATPDARPPLAGDRLRHRPDLRRELRR